MQCGCFVRRVFKFKIPDLARSVRPAHCQTDGNTQRLVWIPAELGVFNLESRFEAFKQHIPQFTGN